MAVYRILVGLVLLVLLGAGANYSCPYPDLAEILSHPQKFAGQRVAVFIEAKIVERTADGFILAQRGNRLRVQTTIKAAAPGEFVAVAGVFQPPARLQAEAVHLAQGRRWKMAVSAIPVLLLVVLLPMALRFDRRSKTLTWRSDSKLRNEKGTATKKASS